MTNIKPQKTTKKSLESGSPSDLPAFIQRMPWETTEEYTRFQAYLYTPEPRTIRKAYRRYCEENGIVPKKNPPKAWFDLLRYPKAIQLAKRKIAAIDRARDEHGRIPDVDGIISAIEKAGKFLAVDGLEDPAQVETNQTQNGLVLIDMVFESLSIDLDGNPIPGRLTWVERQAEYHKHKAG